MSYTLDALQGGHGAFKWVLSIEGCQYLLSDAPQAAVQAAYAGTSYDDGGVSMLPGLAVSLKNSQTLDPWNPFTTMGRCVARVLDTDRTDVFGVLVHRRNAGTETELTATIDRDDTTIPVQSTTGFAASGYVYIGTECIKYTGVTATTFTGCTRGMFSPFGTEGTGAGGNYFANHHRKGRDVNHVQTAALVTQLPRTWIGKRVALRMHRWDPEANTINTRDEAQLVFPGRLVSIADDPDKFTTVLELDHAASELTSGVIGRDFFAADIQKGIWIATGRKFQVTDAKDGTSRTATELEVVASGAAGANQINEGVYSLGEICEFLNVWLASERAAGRLWGVYNWRSPVSNADGLRTVCDWYISDAGTAKVNFGLLGPAEIFAFLGLLDVEPAQDAHMLGINGGGGNKYSNSKYQLCGTAVPYTSVVFKPNGPARIAQEFTEALNYALENETGVFIDNLAYLPAAAKGNCDPTQVWGMFLLDEKVLMVGSYDGTNGFLKNAWIAPFQLVADTSDKPMGYIGRRADEPDEPMRVRQIIMAEATLLTLVCLLLYGTGTTGYNHATYDVLGYGLGLGMPGEYLGSEFERSLANMPGAAAPCILILSEPTKFSEIFEGDLLFRNTFVRWKDQHFEIAQWKTPTLAESVATFNEGNKAMPVGQEGSHRVPAMESDFEVRPVIKLEWCRDFSSTRGAGNYLRWAMVEDQTIVDGGGNAQVRTISLRNTYAQFQATGAAVEALFGNFIAAINLRSRSQRKINRSINQKYWEGYSVGDSITVVDEFARDPITGRRGTTRAAIITKHAYAPGGDQGNSNVEQMTGEIEAMFLDVHRGELYAPAAQVDDTAGAGGFSAGYNNGTKTLRTYSHVFSHTISFHTRRNGIITLSEPVDAASISAGDKAFIHEIDPANPASILSWEREVASVSGVDVTLTTTLSAPAWDATKKYRITYQKYSQVTALQQDHSFQADESLGLIESLDPPDHFCVTDELVNDGNLITLTAGSYNANSGNEYGELIPEMLAGDGRAWDVGTDRALINSINQYLDRKSAHQAPLLWNQPELGVNSPKYTVLWMGPIFFGTEQLSTAIHRTLTLAPFMRSNTGGTTGYIRATLSRVIPTAAPAVTPSISNEVRFVDHFSQCEWTTTSATYAKAADQTLEIAVKDLTFGYAWLCIEHKGTAECRGMTKLIEGVRTVT